MAVSTFASEQRLSVLSLLSLPILGYCLYQTYRYFAKQARIKTMMKVNGCQPPVWYPHLDPILGLDLLLRLTKSFNAHRLMEDFTQIYKTVHGGVYTYFFKAFDETLVSTIEPENVRCVFVTEEKSYEVARFRREVFASVLGRNIFATTGALWKESHDLLKPNLSRSQISDFTMLEKHVQNLFAAIHMQGNRVDLQPLFLLLAMDAGSERFFGESTYTLRADGDPKAKQFSETYGKVSLTMSKSFRVGWLATLLPDKEFQNGSKRMNEFVAEKVERTLEKRRMMSQKAQDMEDAENKRIDRYILMDELARRGVSPTRIRAELLGTIIAARENAANLVSVFFYTLTRRLDILHKVREEVQWEVGDQLPTGIQLGGLKYLRYTLNEVLRLHPPVPTNSRVAIVDTILPLGGGPDGKSPIFVPKNTRVSTIVYAMHRREDIFGPDALELRPERWEDPNFKPGIAFMPWGAGPRVCMGQQYALNFAMYTIVRFLQTFRDILPGDDTTFQEYQTLALSCLHGCKVVLTPA